MRTIDGSEGKGAEGMKQFIPHVLAWAPFAVALALAAQWTLLDWRLWVVCGGAYTTVMLHRMVAAKEQAKKG